MTLDRRHLLKGGLLASAAAAAHLSPLHFAAAWAQEQPFKPEPGARLRMLRWSPFLEAEGKATLANIEAFSKATGVEVRVDNEWQDDVQTKAALAANVGSGPDVVWALHTTPHLFPDKLVDLTEVATYVGQKYGGWYPVIEQYGKNGGRWIGISPVVIGVLPVYRRSWVKQAGFDQFPKDTDGFLKLCQELKRINHPAGFSFGKAPSDANAFCHWLLWSHGGKVTDAEGKVAINSPETGRALDYAKALYDTFVPGTTSWNDAANNRAFLAGEISVTNNSVSVYAKARADKMEIADDIDHALWPTGPVGQPTELHLVFPLSVFRYTPYPMAAKALLAFMTEKAQYDRLIESSVGYVSHALKAAEGLPIWEKDERIKAFRDVGSRGRPISWPGPLGEASASVLADFIVIDMFSEAVSGQPVKEVMAKAERRVQRYYRA